jgi:ribonuclease Z
MLIWCGLTAAGPSVAAAQEIAVTLLGTGTPKATVDRFGPSILVQAGTKTLVFDAGRGVLQRLTQLGVTFGQVDALFLTHLHSDHVVGIPDLWLTGWILSRRDRPLAVFGPSGTADMMEHLRQAFQFDLRIRAADESMPPAGAEIRVAEIKQGVVYDSGGVRVTAFEVDHGPVSPAFGYRIDYGGRSVVLSGDTRFSPNLITFAAHADLVVHEVADGSDAFVADHPAYSRVLAHHSRPADVGKVFQTVQPKLAVYSHIGLNDVTTAQLIARTRATYSGPLVVGEDLMRFTVGAAVAVSRP